MLYALVDEAFGKLAGSLAALEAGLDDPMAYLRAVIPRYIRFGIESPDEYRLAFRMKSGSIQSPIGKNNDWTPMECQNVISWV